jgi:hypothetical protein
VEELRSALSGAEFGVRVDAGALPGESAVVLSRGGQTLGFGWRAEDELTPGQAALRGVLERIRRAARGEGTGRVDPIPVERLLSGNDGQAPARTGLVIRDADALLKLLRGELGGRVVSLPPVDFRTEMLVAVFGGAGLAAGTEIRLDDAISRRADGYLQATVTLYEPAAGCAGASGDRPFELVRVRRMDLELFFIWKVEPRSCPQGRSAARRRGGHRRDFLASGSWLVRRSGQAPRASGAPANPTPGRETVRPGRRLGWE